ncbi:MAG: SUMF1/EgtB/PvdO family nonheme iron enzyme, partial [Phycisphaerales bacterium]|nr:SUMF1/EgtB/PvdO family nonheme iron enzyme [Phycisphaerales bacterium]
PIESADWANFNPGDRANERLLPQAVAPRSGPIAVTDPDDAGGRASRSPDERPRLRDLVDRWVLPVRPLAPGSRDRTRDGVLGMAGNVREWTETMAFPMLSSDDPVAREHRCSKGYAWTMPLEPDMHLMTLHREHRDDRLITLGFRCVKSVDPFAPDPRPHDDTISSGD